MGNFDNQRVRIRINPNLSRQKSHAQVEQSLLRRCLREKFHLDAGDLDDVVVVKTMRLSIQ